MGQGACEYRSLPFISTWVSKRLTHLLTNPLTPTPSLGIFCSLRGFSGRFALSSINSMSSGNRLGAPWMTILASHHAIDPFRDLARSQSTKPVVRFGTLTNAGLQQAAVWQ